MSLEQAISDLTAATRENTELLKKVLSGRSGGSSGGASESTETKRGPGRPKKDKAESDAPTIEQLRKVFGDYLSVDDSEERAARADNVRAILNELGVSKATEIAEDDRAKAIKWVKDLKAGKRPDFMADEGGDDEGDSLL